MPRAVGSKAPEMMESKGRFDVQFMELDDLRSSIRRAHYQDKPEQQGKTPPTATQWADEAAERARRMGSPATNLVIELQYPIIKRFAYLLEKRGVLPKVELNGNAVALEPVSPLLRAQEQEEVVRIDRFAEMIAARFGPAIANIIINQIKHASDLADLLGVDKDRLRDEAEIADAIKQFSGLLQQGNTPDPDFRAARRRRHRSIGDRWALGKNSTARASPNRPWMNSRGCAPRPSRAASVVICSRCFAR
jgi:hypothetical protein